MPFYSTGTSSSGCSAFSGISIVLCLEPHLTSLYIGQGSPQGLAQHPAPIHSQLVPELSDSSTDPSTRGGQVRTTVRYLDIKGWDSSKPKFEPCDVGEVAGHYAYGSWWLSEIGQA